MTIWHILRMEALRDYLSRTGQTDEQFGQAVTLDRTTVCKLKKGQTKLSLEAALRIYDRTRLKLGVLAGAPKRDIEAWRRLAERQKTEAA